MLFTPPAGATREEIGSQQAHATQTTHRCAATYRRSKGSVVGSRKCGVCVRSRTRAVLASEQRTAQRNSSWGPIGTLPRGTRRVQRLAFSHAARARSTHAPLLWLHPQPPAHPPNVRSATRRLVRGRNRPSRSETFSFMYSREYCIHTACWCHS